MTFEQNINNLSKEELYNALEVTRLIEDLIWGEIKSR